MPVLQRNDVLNLFAQVTVFRCLRCQEQRKTVKEQPAPALFFRIYDRPWPRVSAENETSLADILLWRTAKVHRSYEVPLAPCILYRLPVIPRCGRVIRQVYHVWGIDDAGILFSQRTGGGRAAPVGTARERACVPTGSDDRQPARGDGA